MLTKFIQVISPNFRPTAPVPEVVKEPNQEEELRLRKIEVRDYLQTRFGRDKKITRLVSGGRIPNFCCDKFPLEADVERIARQKIKGGKLFVGYYKLRGNFVRRYSIR